MVEENLHRTVQRHYTAELDLVMIDILYRDTRFVAVHKPSGMLVHRNAWCPREPACLEILRDQIGRFVFPVHRLDRATSGVLVFALDADAAAGLAALFRRRCIHKSYLAVVRGFIDVEGRFDEPLKRGSEKESLPAITEFQRQAIVELHVPVGRYLTGRYSLVRINPRTGRHHQIRRHFAHASHPVIGDRKHGDKAHNLFFDEKLGVSRLLLMATDLAFEHPFNKTPVRIRAPLPPDVNGLFSLMGWPAETECRAMIPADQTASPRPIALASAPFLTR